MTPEQRAADLVLSNPLWNSDRDWRPLVAAIRAAENDALERAAVTADEHAAANEYYGCEGAEWAAEAIRKLKHVQ